jgi:Bacteriophage lambda head decoration protein D
MSETYTPDNLRAGDYPMITDEVILASGAGALVRGTVLGRINVGVVPATGTLVAGGAADGTCTVVTGGPDTIGGIYTLICTAKITNGGTFNLVSPLGVILATGSITVGAGGTLVFVTDELNATITDGTNDFDAGDYFTVTIPAGSGKYTIVDSTNVDGSAAARAVLLEAKDATSADVEHSPVALTGEFTVAALTFGGTDTAADHREYMRRYNMFQKVASTGGLTV